MDINNINVLVLAYLGDSVYELFVRDYLVKMGITNVNDLQTESIKYVSAKNQAFYIKKLIDEDFFNEDELNIIKRGRNYKNNRHPKNCDIVTYKYATALECIIGYYYLTKNNEKIEELMKKILG